MIQLTDYLGETLNIDEQVIVTVSNYTQDSVAGSKVEYRVNPNSIAVIYVTDTPSDIAGMTDYVVPITLVFDNGQTEVIYLNPAYYRGFLTLSPTNQLQYEYQIGSQYRAFSTSTSYSTIATQIAAINTGGGGYWTQNSGNLYPTTLTDNVGIGTATPTYKLQLEGDYALHHNDGTNDLAITAGASGYSWGIQGTTYLAQEAFGNNGVIDRMVLQNSNTATKSRIFQAVNSIETTITDDDAGSQSKLTQTVGFFQFSLPEDVNTLYLNTGNVGIGTATPTEKLEVGGNVKMVGVQYKVATVIYGNNYTFSNDDYCLLVGLSGTGGVAVDLTDYTPNNGQVIVIKDAGKDASTNNIVITGTIDGTSGYTINTDGASLQLIYSSTALSWFTI